MDGLWGSPGFATSTMIAMATHTTHSGDAAARNRCVLRPLRFPLREPLCRALTVSGPRHMAGFLVVKQAQCPLRRHDPRRPTSGHFCSGRSLARRRQFHFGEPSEPAGTARRQPTPLPYNATLLRSPPGAGAAPRLPRTSPRASMPNPRQAAPLHWRAESPASPCLQVADAPEHPSADSAAFKSQNCSRPRASPFIATSELSEPTPR